MYTSDRRMLELKEILKAKGVIRFDTDFCAELGMQKQQLYSISNPEKAKRNQHFTPEHIESACKKFGADANWMFGLAEDPFKK